MLFKRPDGFHEVETGMLELPFYDILEINKATELSFESSGLPIPGEGNLVLDAFKVFQEYKSIPAVSIHLHKQLPMGGGLGGGSSDAAFALKQLRDLFAPEITNVTLVEMAAKIGSDCAFFVQGGLQIGKGRGEVLTPLENKLKGYWVVLINLGYHVSTKEAYAGISPKSERKSLAEILELPITVWNNELVNDFEEPVFKLFPQLAEVKQNLYNQGAIYAAMSGSGSTMFGIFPEQKGDLYPAAQLEKWVQLN